jgi:hypothetical protein
MQDPFRAFVLGLGIMLGLVEGGSDPMLAARLYRDGQYLRVSAEIRDGISRSTRDLVASGNAICLTLTVERKGRVLARVARSLAYDKVMSVWRVTRTEDGKTLESISEEAAYILLCQWDSIPLGTVAEYESLLERKGVEIVVRASILVNDAPEEDSRLLWNYKRPERTFRIKSMTEVPY